MAATHRVPVLVVVLFISTLTGCGGADVPETSSPAAAGSGPPPRPASSPAAAAAPPSSIADLPRGPWTDLARRLVEARDLGTAVEVTRDVLAHGGVATIDGDRDLIAAIAPAAAFTATPLETVHLAMEARQRRHVATLTAAEFAQMLEGFGWPFRGSRGDPRNRADSMMRIQQSEDLQEAVRVERSTRQDEEAARGRDLEASIETERQAAMKRDEELVARMREAELAYQKARQGVGRATPENRAAAEEQLKVATTARLALIEERRAARDQASGAGRDRRVRARAADAEARRAEQISERIGPDLRAGEQLMEMFAVWVREAAANPHDPHSFTPLFLAEMARLQDAPVDLAGSRFSRPRRGDGPPVDLAAFRSQQFRLTLLEIQLFAAAFHRTGARTAAVVPARPWQIRDAPVRVSFAQDSCTEFKKSLQDWGDPASAAAQWAAGKGIDKAVGATMDAATAEAFGKAMAAAGMAAKIGKLVSFYRNNQVTVKADPPSTHKPPEGPAIVKFTATAGLSEEDWKDYQDAAGGPEGSKVDRATRDCLNQLGLPTAPELADLAKDAEEWLVDWRIVEGAGQHAYMSYRGNDWYLPGRLAMKLKRAGPYSASATVNVDITPETQQTGRVVSAFVTTQASLDAAGMPSLSTLVNAMTGLLGLADSLLELCVGWYQSMNMPKAYATIDVQYHCTRQTILVNARNAVADGGGDDEPQDCLLEQGR